MKSPASGEAQFNANRLVLARQRRRLTAKRLSELTGLTPVTLSRLEKGENSPSQVTLEKIAQALEFPLEFFLGDDLEAPSAESASFRSLSSMTARERHAALAAGAVAFLFSEWVDQNFNLPSPDLLNLRGEEPAVAARTLRQHWGLGEKPIKNVINVLESKGVRVFSLYENTKNVDAFSSWNNDRPFIFLNNFKSTEHSRFDAAHELGHLILHRHGGVQGKDVEREADAFASSFLMPEADVIAEFNCMASVDGLIELKKRWGVSVAALAYRIHKIGLTSKWHHRSLFIEISQRGYRTQEPNSIPRETSTVWKKVFTHLWAERVTVADVANQLHLPDLELQNLIFGLTHVEESPPARGFQGALIKGS